MNPDPILDELYAAKEALAAKFNFDMHALAESFRRAPSWAPVNRPARPIHTAQKRLRQLTDPGDEIRELRAIREQIAAENGNDIHRIVQAAEKCAREHPLPSPGKSRKLPPPEISPAKAVSLRSSDPKRSSAKDSKRPAFRSHKSKSRKT